MIELISNHFVAFIRAQIFFSNLRVFSFPVFLSKELTQDIRIQQHSAKV
jgi:hypothetical protein